MIFARAFTLSCMVFSKMFTKYLNILTKGVKASRIRDILKRKKKAKTILTAFDAVKTYKQKPPRAPKTVNPLNSPLLK